MDDEDSEQQAADSEDRRRRVRSGRRRKDAGGAGATVHALEAHAQMFLGDEGPQRFHLDGDALASRQVREREASEPWQD